MRAVVEAASTRPQRGRPRGAGGTIDGASSGESWKRDPSVSLKSEKQQKVPEREPKQRTKTARPQRMS